MIQFPDFDDHATTTQLLALGFVDISFHNDTCPSFERDNLIVFVDYLDANLSELKGQRFSVIQDAPNGQTIDHGSYNSLSDVLAAIA
jgi:hypothetical protein